MKIEELRKFSVEMQSFGVVLPDSFHGRRGGAGPAEGQTLIIDDHYLTVPSGSWYVEKSDYSILHSKNGYELCKDKKYLCSVKFPDEPKYYPMKTPSGLSLKKIALIHGKDCFASTVYQKCLCWNTPSRCRFCAIELSLLECQTISRKEPADLAFAAEKAYSLDRIKHITLTSGVYTSEHETLTHLCGCIKEIKSKVPAGIHIQICPAGNRFSLIDRLKEAGADTIGIHCETCSMDILKKVAPFKAGIGLEIYRQWWDHAVRVFGKNQVSTFLIAGFGEDKSQMIDFAESLCDIGVFPYILPFRPIPGSDLADLRPPCPDTMMELYRETAKHLKRYGLSSKLSKAGCVRCGACSCLALFE